jgi:hypothetical protein
VGRVVNTFVVGVVIGASVVVAVAALALVVHGALALLEGRRPWRAERDAPPADQLRDAHIPTEVP